MIAWLPMTSGLSRAFPLLGDVHANAVGRNEAVANRFIYSSPRLEGYRPTSDRSIMPGLNRLIGERTRCSTSSNRTRAAGLRVANAITRSR